MIALCCLLSLVVVACSGGEDDSELAQEEGASGVAVGGDQGGLTADAASEAGSVALPVPPEESEGPVSVDAGVNAWVDAATDAESTFATDVDTASYTLARAAVERGALPDPAGVRVEEFVNAQPGGYTAPQEGFAIRVDQTTSTLRSEPDAQLVRVGLQAAVPPGPRAPIALTFVVDTSGSMERAKAAWSSCAARSTC